ncbi:MAG: proline dehydrogenase family protein [Bacteroidota bacterium]
MSTTILTPDFNNSELAFQAKSHAELKRTYRLMKLVDSPFLTKIGPPMLTLAFQLGLPIKGLVRKTLFDQFCAGESLEETAATTASLAKFGVQTILDYSVEGEKTEEGFDATLEEFIATLEHGSRHEAVAFTALKLTGLASVELMESIQQGDSLNAEERVAFDRFKARLTALAQAAHSYQTPFFIDAEESWIQDVIDARAEELMQTYNQEKALIYTTVQLYRHDRLAYLERLIADSQEQGYILGVKLVRGAYMEKERDRAEELYYQSPIQPSKEATDRDYDLSLELCLEHIDHVAICAGTHNEASTLKLTQMMAQRGLPANHPHVLFAQLQGMSDNISFNLAHAGFQTAKYLPYGPIRAVIPYLIRRAQENTAIAGQSSREVELLKAEIRRRSRR